MEFGYKGQVVDNVDGNVLDHSMHEGNPPDAPLLPPAIDRVQILFDRLVRAVTADRGYGENKIDQELRDLGVTTVVIPRKGKPGRARRELEHGRRFRRLVKWRTGSEGRISCLKRRYGWDRTLFDILAGAQTWCGLGVLAHNIVKIANLIPAHQLQPTSSSRPGRPRPVPTSAPNPVATRASTRSAIPHRRLTHAPWSIQHARTAPPNREDPSRDRTAPAERDTDDTPSPARASSTTVVAAPPASPAPFRGEVTSRAAPDARRHVAAGHVGGPGRRI